MAKIKVLIADDSVVYRSQIRAALQDIAQTEVVGAASNGRLAIERLLLSPVDLLILDLEMPEMDGIQTLTEIRQRGIKTQVLMFSSSSQQGAKVTLEALRLGASDFIAKPNMDQDSSTPSQKIRARLEPKIHALFQSHLPSDPNLKAVNTPLLYPQLIWEFVEPKVVVIGSSTGGPTVLEKIFSELKGPLRCPILIAQHMPPVFTAALAERLSKLSGIPAREATHGTKLDANEIFIAPGDFHLRLTGSLNKVTMTLDQGPQINSVRPAVDALFVSAAEIYKEKCFGIVLTGMGADGKVGAENIKKHGGAVLIQNQESCVVFGMPGAVMSAGAFDRVATPDQIIQILVEKASFRAPTKLRVEGI